ncbi:hypothetical protein AAFF_G00099660 [Aldrovandia affinis]|uniref:CLOCK-interacting pacemaker-like n=1 Tax=Aldrovandia affinis TaxID=143900 RepID=A0AAD7RUY7_9TELE|nr:hypothetical protein AAFF_G00099660 [Aldrovandia affinis]
MSSKANVGGQRRLCSYLMDNMKTYNPGSERDSGFSDGSSGYLSAVDQMDSEDRGGRRGAQPRMAVMTGSYPGLSPMIIMNNVVLNQPNTPTQTLKPWGFQPTLEMVPQPQVVFLQPVVSRGNGASQKSAPDKRRKSRKYLPILKSYPKIAPHPGETLSEKGGSGSSEQSSLASGQQGRHRHRHRHDKQPGRPVGVPDPTVPCPRCSRSPKYDPSHECPGFTAALCPAHPVAEADALALAPWAWVMEPASEDSDSCLGDLSGDDCKRQRFCNTYNVLHQSGLLDITLRTKELIRQNRRAQGQLEDLREKTGLFVEAVRSGDPQVWTRLQLAMMEAGAERESQEDREKDTQQGALLP